MPDPESILVIRLSSLGDVLMTIPAVTAMRTGFPSSKITWLVEGSVGEFLSYQDFLDRVIVFPRSALVKSIRQGSLLKAARGLTKFFRELRKERFDIIADYHGIIKSALLARIAGPAVRIGFGKSIAKEMSHLFYDETVDLPDKRMHKVERNMLITRHLGVNGPVPSPELKVPPEIHGYIDNFIGDANIGKPLVAVNPFSSGGSTYKRWGFENYARLIGMISEKTGAQILVLWGPGEKEAAEELIGMSPGNPLLACPTTVAQLFALLKRMDMYIGGDTGVMHLAAISGTPVVAIFGPTDHRINAPYGKKHRLIRREVPCSPCKEKQCTNRICLSGITVEEICDAVVTLFEQEIKN